MSLADALTWSRVAASPLFFLVFMAWRTAPGSVLWGAFLAVLFVLIEISDVLDGFFARRSGRESEMGKLVDPFSDSVSRLTYFLCFTASGLMPLWVFVLILYRDLTVAFVRVLVQRRGVAMGARVTGKIKAWIYGLTGLLLTTRLLASEALNRVSWIGILESASRVAVIVCAVVALGSMIDYLVPTILGSKSSRKG